MRNCSLCSKRITRREHVGGCIAWSPKHGRMILYSVIQRLSYAPNPVLVIIDVQPTELGLPTKAYYAIEEVNENATQKSKKVFVHVSSEIAAHEVEEIGKSRRMKTNDVSGKLEALKGLDARLKEIRSYLDLVIEGKLPLNHEILYHLQDIFNLLPNLNVAELVKAFAGIYLTEADRLLEMRTLAFELVIYLLPVNFAVGGVLCKQ
ncbi:26S proteasome non-ATPase regulatory subunit 7 homolog A [Tanacetum coccineum]